MLGLKKSTSVCRSQPSGNKKNDRIPQPPRSNLKNKVEAQHRNVTLSANKKNHVKDSIFDANVEHTMLNVNSKLICVKCNQCMFDANHDACFLEYVSDLNMRSKSKPTGRKFTLVGNMCPLTKITITKAVPLRVPIPLEVTHVSTRIYTMKSIAPKTTGSNSKSKISKSRIANKMESGTSWGSNLLVAPSSSLDKSRFSTLFSDLEVAFRKHTCFVRNLEGVDLLSGSREKNMYTLSISDMMQSSPVKFLASKDEAPDFIIRFLKMIQRILNASVRKIRTDNGTEFVNQTLRDYYESFSISHENKMVL
ncbi:integrase, catalytic region, zinc finger, CCHC-type containing protein [Tanacetum coccineum]